MSVTILAGDVGGTNTRFALHDARGLRSEASLPNRDFARFEAALAEFLAGHGRPAVDAAAIAVAGPILDGRVRMTNLEWTLEERVISQELGGAPVRLLNDLEAAAHGVLVLPVDESRPLLDAPGRPRGNVAVVAAGTGLGEALLTWHGATPIAIASEGGHADYAPRDALEIALLEWLGRTRDHVSWEHVVSGPGVLAIYDFLRDTGRADEPAPLRARLAEAVEPAVVVTQSAVAGEFPICVRALDVFVRAYGAEAGNLALKGLALGGVWVAGGIAPHVLVGPFAEGFVRAFCDKGRYAEFMRRIPVRLVLGENASLLGAAAVAGSLLGAPAA